VTVDYCPSVCDAVYFCRLTKTFLNYLLHRVLEHDGRFSPKRRLLLTKPHGVSSHNTVACTLFNKLGAIKDSGPIHKLDTLRLDTVVKAV
jgi:hypothetical protein